jgi:uncharacterized protein (TIGR02231 family)
MTDLSVAFDPRTGLVDAGISAVLVMEDRAQITRRAQVELVAGENPLTLESITPLLADRTLRCKVSGMDGDSKGAAKVLDVRVTRCYLSKAARPEKEKELTESIQQLVDQLVDSADRLRIEEQQGLRLVQALGTQAVYMADRQQVGAFDAQWPGQMEEVFEQQEQVDERKLKLQKEIVEKEDRIRRLQEERRAVVGLIDDYKATVTTEIHAKAQGLYWVEWEYQVPCALWRPEYTAELNQGQQTAALSWYASGTVWQATLEEWDDVELSFSTARPALGAELPLLVDEELSTRPKTDVEKKVVELSSRDQAIEKTTSARLKESDTPPGLDDGGQTRTFQVHSKVTVPSDGRPHRFAFDDFQDDVRCEYVCFGEKATFVFLRTLQSNRSEQPLLAGPVVLIKDGVFVGRSNISYVAKDEVFALSWGSEDGLVVLRDANKTHSQVGLRKRHKHEFSVNIYLANYTGTPKNVLVVERLPVSEIESVEVSIVEVATTKGFEKDQHGLCSWHLVLAAGQEQRVQLSYSVEMTNSIHWDG